MPLDVGHEASRDWKEADFGTVPWGVRMRALQATSRGNRLGLGMDNARFWE